MSAPETAQIPVRPGRVRCLIFGRHFWRDRRAAALRQLRQAEQVCRPGQQAPK